MTLPGILVSSTENSPAIRALGKSSVIPERFGVDVLCPALRLGAQRKTVSDLVASMVGDRLAKELRQMKRLYYRFLIVEGRFNFNADGEWINGFQRFTVEQYRGALYTIQREHTVVVVETRDTTDTAKEIGHIIRWASKGSHTSLDGRPKSLVSKWGTRDDRDWQEWLCMGFEGIGPKQARAIVKHFGEAPLMWKVTIEQLQEVPGIGKLRAERLMRALHNGSG